MAEANIVDRIELVQTCGACPEQYDAFQDGEQVGYLRLRHGWFSVDYPNSGGDEILAAEPKGDGIFEPDERDHYLTLAKMAIAARHHSPPKGCLRHE